LAAGITRLFQIDLAEPGRFVAEEALAAGRVAGTGAAVDRPLLFLAFEGDATALPGTDRGLGLALFLLALFLGTQFVFVAPLLSPLATAFALGRLLRCDAGSQAAQQRQGRQKPQHPAPSSRRSQAAN
jgi:hypothetical protein